MKKIENEKPTNCQKRALSASSSSFFEKFYNVNGLLGRIGDHCSVENLAGRVFPYMLHCGCDSSHISAYKDKHMSSAFGILCNIMDFSDL